MNPFPEPLLRWLETLAPARAVRSGQWTYPMAESLHVVGIAVMVGAAMLFDLRLLGAAGRHVPVTSAARWLLPVSWAGFGLVALTGMLMFSANATLLAENPAFQLKLALILLAGANALVFRLGPYRRVAVWDTATAAPLPAKAVAVVSLLAWTVVTVCGRLIAYV
ncbi:MULTISPECIES: DUF6644 family protein [unclassified Streptomyces]|uniref:DUF6644 family protein n=1 Tax=unclassified Streptomyces TaxID=2593676 RepID=UPI000A53BAFD|nr:MULTISPECIES: DUF6644 family protein [unclassified Streptomyces]AZM61726.1 hypothetical protein DLM49_21185 [Streptomyces sp. WAC 01438]RSN02180.1 hypothetical protein DMA10_00345 [Streptomyces sp. WAC 01420]